MSLIKTCHLIILLMAVSLTAEAQQVEDNTFGGWNFVEVNHDFKCGVYTTGYLEFDNYRFSRMECVYGRFSVGYKPLKWLSFGVNYVPLYEPYRWKNYVEADVVGTLKSGDFKVSIRERFRYCITSNTNELRSRLKVAYHIPNTRFTPYLAPEVFTCGTEWTKTRHYVACCYSLTDIMQLEWYYLYYAFKDAPAEHVIGLGLDFDF